MTREEKTALNIWEHSRGVIEVLTSYPMGAWLNRRDGHVINELLDKISIEIEQKARPNEIGGRGNGKAIRYGLCMALEIIDKYRREIEE